MRQQTERENENNPRRHEPSLHAPIQPKRTTRTIMTPATITAMGALVNAFNARPSSCFKFDINDGVNLKFN